jgi:hypothetical protein
VLKANKTIFFRSGYIQNYPLFFIGLYLGIVQEKKVDIFKIYGMIIYPFLNNQIKTQEYKEVWS